MKKILYLASVEWGWIKQRPHFLAEELSRYYEITFVNITLPGRAVKSSVPGLEILNIYRLPFERYSVVAFISKLIRTIQLQLKRNNPDYIWVASPLHLETAKKFKGKAKVIYDCMDDMLAFPMTEKDMTKRRKCESELFRLADYVFASAEHLKKTLIERYGSREVFVINNAISSTLLEEQDVDVQKCLVEFEVDHFNITYVGTISEWFDFDLLLYILNNIPRVCFYLFGPSRVAIPKHDRIKYCGAVEHQYIKSVMEASDALIMPFKITELIRSVNPVKLYEYIGSGKPSLAPRYGESVPFSDFVALYENEKECLSYIEQMTGHEYKVKAKKDREAFLERNTWNYRAKQISELIK